VANELESIARFSDPIEAELARSRLADEGLNATTVGGEAGNMFGMSYTTGGIDLLVPAEDRDRAESILADLAKEIDARKHPLKEAITAERPLIPAGEEPLTPEELAAQPTYAEVLTEYAFRASLFGSFLCPVLTHSYALWLLMYATFRGEPIRAGHSVKYYAAFIICIVWITAVGVVLLQAAPAGWVLLALVGNFALGFAISAVVIPRQEK
jgi:hypothetical protein